MSSKSLLVKNLSQKYPYANVTIDSIKRMEECDMSIEELKKILYTENRLKRFGAFDALFYDCETKTEYKFRDFCYDALEDSQDVKSDLKNLLSKYILIETDGKKRVEDVEILNDYFADSVGMKTIITRIH